MSEHLTPEDGTGWLTPDDELEEIELGGRVDLWRVNWELAQIYTRECDRVQGAVSYCIAAVATATSHRGLPFPTGWWPPSVGPMPEIE